MLYDHVILPGSWYEIVPVICGFEDCKPGHIYGPAVRSYYLMHYVMEGCGTFFRDDGCYSVKNGDIFVIRPGEVTTYQASQDDPWYYVWLGFTSAEEIPFLSEAVLRQMPVRHLFAWIRENVASSDIDGRLYCLTHELLWTLSRSAGREQRPGSRYAEYLKAYIENSYMNRISMVEVADRLHIDRRYLTALFRERYGQSPQSYLVEFRLAKAAGFLENGCSVADAAIMSGFSDLPNFSKRFKKKYGICPKRKGRG